MLNKCFASDNTSGVHHKILKSLIEANEGNEISYGDDFYTFKAVEKFRNIFNSNVDVYFVTNGTAANVLSIKSICKPYEAIICASNAHINTDECGAVESITGCKLLTIESENGKICPKAINKFLTSKGNVHHVQPRLISISQPTEYGTVYSIEEIKDMCDFAHSNDMFLHIDGARIANAVASLNASVFDMIVKTGVDVISFGGTKNGMMYGDSIVFINNMLSVDTKYYRKQYMQLVSKMRYISAQFLAYLEDDLWIQNAVSANRMAQLLAKKLQYLNEIKIIYPVNSNSIFVSLPHEKLKYLLNKYLLYIWDENIPVVRIMCSFNTSEQQIEGLIGDIKVILGSKENKDTL